MTFLGAEQLAPEENPGEDEAPVAVAAEGLYDDDSAAEPAAPGGKRQQYDNVTLLSDK